MKKNYTFLIIFLIIVLIVFIIKQPQTNYEDRFMTNNDGQIIDTETNEIVDVDLGVLYNKFAPIYIDTASRNCEIAGGDWIEEVDRIGCYNIPVWDHASQCGALEQQVMKNFCVALDSRWTCGINEVSCEKR